MKTEARSEPPPLAYDLTELQRDANRRYGWPARKTLAVLQGLYERHKLVTYPRTDSRYITSDMVPTLSLRLRSMGVGPYAAMAKPLLQKPLQAGKRLVNNSKVTDHHAIIPTEQTLNQQFSTRRKSGSTIDSPSFSGRTVSTLPLPPDYHYHRS